MKNNKPQSNQFKNQPLAKLKVLSHKDWDNTQKKLKNYFPFFYLVIKKKSVEDVIKLSMNRIYHSFLNANILFVNYVSKY
jgi:hypothetical protein